MAPGFGITFVFTHFTFVSPRSRDKAPDVGWYHARAGAAQDRDGARSTFSKSNLNPKPETRNRDDARSTFSKRMLYSDVTW